MQTVKIELEDNIYQDMLKNGIDVQVELKDMIKKLIYHKEHKIAKDIKDGIDEVKKGNSRAIEDLFNEI